MRGMWSLLDATISDWYEDRAQRIGAALAYYTIFALTPGLIVLIAVAGLFFGGNAEVQIVVADSRADRRAGSEGDRVDDSQRAHRALGVSGTLLTLIPWRSGSGAYSESFRTGSTRSGGHAAAGAPRGRHAQERLLSFAMVVGIGFVLLVSLALSAWLVAVGTYFGQLLPAPAAALEALNFVISFAVITALFAMTFKLLPDVQIAWRDVWLGAAVTSLLFTIGKFLIGLYLGKSSIASAYGAAGSLVIIVVWVYYSAQILLLGAEFTKVYVKRRGSGFAPAEIAVPVTAEARAEQGMGVRRP